MANPCEHPVTTSFPKWAFDGVPHPVEEKRCMSCGLLFLKNFLLDGAIAPNDSELGKAWLAGYPDVETHKRICGSNLSP